MTGFGHIAVMVEEVVAALRPGPGGFYVDGTVGGGEHAAAILAVSAPDGRLWGCDRDAEALEAARTRLAEFGSRVELRHGNFGDLSEWLRPSSCDGVLLDLGVSSHQLDTPGRGFSFQHDGPLDMRADRGQSLTAAQLVNTASAAELERMFWEYGEEPHARRLARAIAEARQVRPFGTTRQLAELIEQVVPRRGGRIHPATRVFQSLRIAVNDELGSLRRGLKAAARVLKPGGRLVVITFHGLEARVVKEFGRDVTRDYQVEGPVDVPEMRRAQAPLMRWVHRRAVRPGEAELKANPRSRSAQLRVLEKL